MMGKNQKTFIFEFWLLQINFSPNYIQESLESFLEDILYAFGTMQ